MEPVDFFVYDNFQEKQLKALAETIEVVKTQNVLEMERVNFIKAWLCKYYLKYQK